MSDNNFLKISSLNQVSDSFFDKELKDKALFLDRDGVINIDHGHVFEIERFDFIDGIFEFCKKAQDFGYKLIIVTNQAGIGKGFYSEDEFFKLRDWVEQEFKNKGIEISKTFYCPYHLEAKDIKYKKDSFDRKPNPGMILSALKDFGIKAENSIMIGDKETDIEAANNANIAKKILFSYQSL